MPASAASRMLIACSPRPHVSASRTLTHALPSSSAQAPPVAPPPAPPPPVAPPPPLLPLASSSFSPPSLSLFTLRSHRKGATGGTDEVVGKRAHAPALVPHPLESVLRSVRWYSSAVQVSAPVWYRSIPYQQKPQ
eukprot:3202416-Rhodomonas_salina.1